MLHCSYQTVFFFRFHFCKRTPQMDFIYLGCGLIRYLIFFATHTLVSQQIVFIERCLHLLVFLIKFLDFILILLLPLSSFNSFSAYIPIPSYTVLRYSSRLTATAGTIFVRIMFNHYFFFLSRWIRFSLLSNFLHCRQISLRLSL